MPIRERNAPHSFRRLLTLASDAAPAVCATYFCTAVHAGFQNVLRARQPFRFPRSPAFVIDRGRSRFRARNAPHSFRRLLTHAHKRCRPAVCATYFVQLYTRSFQMLCGTATIPLLTLDRLRHCRVGCRSVRGMHCIHSGGLSCSQANGAAPAVCATYFVHLYVAL